MAFSVVCFTALMGPSDVKARPVMTALALDSGDNKDHVKLVDPAETITCAVSQLLPSGPDHVMPRETPLTRKLDAYPHT